MLKTESIKQFLKTTLSPIAQLYESKMEVQVNVAKDDGRRITGKLHGRIWRAWQGEKGDTWKSFRIPWNADTAPEYKDTDLRFDLERHVEGIGMTGWDWKNKQSLWVGYDFDSIVGHKEGLSNDKLDELEQKAAEIPWVTLVRSTGGKGIHLYLFFDKPVQTLTHTEHAAIARSLLSVLTVEVGFNFTTSVDTCGSILWCYHRKMEGTNGLTYIKKGDKFPVIKIPKNWKEHILVCNRTRKKTRSGDKGLESLSSALRNFYLDSDHHRILKWFSTDSQYDYWWDTDYNMLVCHTKDLLSCHKSLELRGIFETNTGCSSTQNCFCFPIRSGSFIVRRHGSKTREARTWTTDEQGWTKCYFNAEPTVHDACITNGALENEKGEYVFNTCKEALGATKLLNIDFTFPDCFKERQIIIKVKKGKLILKLEVMDNDSPTIPGFLKEKKLWIKVLIHKEEFDTVQSQDTLVRHVISDGSDAGWYIDINKRWIAQNKSNVLSVLVSQMIGFKRAEIEQMVGHSILDPWELVNRPFEDEYLGGRKWNKDAAQLSSRPMQGKIEYWWELLDHIGNGLNDVVSTNPWCQNNNIATGSDYLFAWVASMIQRPIEPLPYLFFFGGQETGKSTFHEGLSLLFKNSVGYTRADQALKDKSGFNAELAHSVLCVVEETDLGKDINALNKMKDWVTGKTIAIRAMHKNTYNITNSTHWIHCANDGKYCLVLPGDTRIMAIEVDILHREIPKIKLLEYLQEEVPAFLYELLQYELPTPEGRLGIPCLTTEAKREIMEENFNELEEFIRDRTEIKMGHLTTLDDFYNYFKIYLMNQSSSKESDWSSIRKVSSKFPKKPPIVKGQYGTENKVHIGNLTMEMNAVDKDYKWVLNKKRLMKEEYRVTK